MEEYRNTVIKLHAIYSMIISKFTSNISKSTSKNTSKTNQNEPLIRGAIWGGILGNYPGAKLFAPCDAFSRVYPPQRGCPSIPQMVVLGLAVSTNAQG